MPKVTHEPNSSVEKLVPSMVRVWDRVDTFSDMFCESTQVFTQRTTGKT